MTDPATLYSGWDQLFTMNHEEGPYCGPQSTTMSRDVASSFTAGKGSISTFQSSYTNPFQFCVGVSVSSISAFRHEKEVVLYDQFLPLTSSKVLEDDPRVLVDYLLFTLLRKPYPIVLSRAFFEQIGIKWSGSWIPMVMTHKLLLQQTRCGEMTVLDRLSDELEIGFFQFLVEIRKAIVLNADAINFSVSSPPSDRKERNTEIAEYIFAAALGTTAGDKVKEIKFENKGQMTIPLDDVFHSDVNSLRLHLFCKAANSSRVGRTANASFQFVSIYSTVLPIYDFKEDIPVVITESADIPAVDEQRGQRGNLVIRCSSDFTIGPDAVIDGSGVMNDSGGGVIRIISSNGTVTNKGTLRCNGVDGGRGGDIYIVADSFVNEGIIECGPNGRIFVFCTTFINHNEIDPGPIVNVPGMEEWGSEDVDRAEWKSIDYLMQSLLNKKEMIVNPEEFYTEIGVRCEEEWCELMDDHGLWNAESQFEGMTIARRLADELHLEYFMD